MFKYFKKKKSKICYRKKLLDIDTKEDLLAYETGFSDIELLGAASIILIFYIIIAKNEKRVLRLI